MPAGRTIPPARIIRFGPFELDVRAAELRKHGIRIRLHEQPFRILLMLLTHPGEVVLRDEIRLALWPNNTIVEFDHSINAAIQRLREALSDSADNPKYVETLTRRGYRFIGTMEHDETAVVEAEAVPAEPVPEPAPASDPTDWSGQTFSHFRVVGKLGAGGMGVVYRAEDLKLGRQVALKVLPLPAKDAPPTLLERFRREAQAASALNHPNICTIHGVEEFAGQPVIVMELVEGETLEARLVKGAFPLQKALPLAIQLADAMDEAHRKRIIHRDLKPANIMLTKSGVKILDFGLAKMEHAIVEGGEGGTEATVAGTILGTWQYMSPEQTQGKDVDGRSDIFTFGCVLLEMLTGKRAFTGATPADLIGEILTKDPLESAIAAVPLSPALAGIIRHCLAKNPEDRFQSARDLVFALQSLSADPVALPAVAVQAKPWRVHPRILVAAGILIAVVGAWWVGRQSRTAAIPDFQRLTFRRGIVQAARFAPDGRSVIYAASWEGQPIELYTVQLGVPESARSLGFSTTGLLAVSPTGEVAVSSHCVLTPFGDCRGTLARMPWAGGAPREILENVRFADWGPDGKQLAVSRIGSAGKQNRLEFPIDKVLFEAAGTGWPGTIRVSPKGDMVAFMDHDYAGNDGSVAVVDIKGKKRILTRKFNGFGGLAWAPGGKEIWFDASAGEMKGTFAVTLSGTMRLLMRAPTELALQDIAADGRVLFVRGDSRAGVHFLGADAPRPREMTWSDWAVNPILSADGSRVLFTESGFGTGGKTIVYLRGTDGSPAVRLGEQMAGHSLSPDGEWAAAQTDDQQRRRIVLLPIKAGQPISIDTGSLNPAAVRPNVGWFPDSRRISYSAIEPGHRVRTYVQAIQGGQPRPITPEGIYGSVLSPDGSTLLAWDEQGHAFLCSTDGATQKPVPYLTRDHAVTGFSADGRAVYVTRRGERPPKVWRMNLESGRFELWRDLSFIDPAGVTSVYGARVTPDGKSMVYGMFRTMSDLYIAEGLR